MLRRGNQQRGAARQPTYARSPAAVGTPPTAGGGSGGDVMRMLSDAAARQFWEKYFGSDREVEWSFFWESLQAEYSAILDEYTDRESEMLLKAFIDSNQNDSVSVLELNKMSKDSGMVKGLTEFFKKADGGEKPVILDTRARKFWNKYIGRDKKYDVLELWEALTQEFDHLLVDADMINAEKSFMKQIDLNRNGSITNIEFNTWTRKKGLEAMMKEVVNESKHVWHDDEDGQWGESEAAKRYRREEEKYVAIEREEREASREMRHDKYRQHDQRRDRRDDRSRYDDSDEDNYRRRHSDDTGRRGGRDSSTVRRRDQYSDESDEKDTRRRNRQPDRGRVAQSSAVESDEDDFEKALAARIAREEEEMKESEMRREKQRDLDRQRNDRQRDASKQERQADILRSRREMMQKQEQEDARRKEEMETEARNARWAEADAKFKAQANKRLAKIEEIEKKMKIEDPLRFSCLTLKGHEGAITGMSLCGDRLCTSSIDKTIKVWDVDKQKVKKTLTGHTSRVNSVASDSKSIITGSRDGTVHIWDLRTGEITDTEPSEQVAISYVAMGTVPRHATIGRQDGEIRLLDMRTPITVVRTFFGHTGAITGLDFNGDMLASSSADGTARVWDFGTGTCIHTLKGHYSDVSSVQLDEAKIVTGSYDETIRYWDLASGKCRQKTLFPLGMVSSIRVDGSELIAGSLCNNVNVYDSTTGELRYTLGGRDGHTQGVNSVLAHKGQVYSCSNDMTAKVWTLLD